MKEVCFYDHEPFFNFEELGEDISDCESFVKMTEDSYDEKPKQIFVKIKDNATFGDLWIDLVSHYPTYRFNCVVIAPKGTFTLRQALEAMIKHINRRNSRTLAEQPFHSRYSYRIKIENGKYIQDPDALPF